MPIRSHTPTHHYVTTQLHMYMCLGVCECMHNCICSLGQQCLCWVHGRRHTSHIGEFRLNRKCSYSLKLWKTVRVFFRLIVDQILILFALCLFRQQSGVEVTAMSSSRKTKSLIFATEIH